MQLETMRKILLRAMAGSGFERVTFFAGGCVRDYLLGRKTEDFDLTVALPDGGIRLADYLFQLGLVSQPAVYPRFGTALVHFKGHKLELVMTRRESYRMRSRKPEVLFGTLEQDVLRRDFTVNALLMGLQDRKILDISGRGLADLPAQVIRATVSPELIFQEDPLRLLRAVRFATTLGFEIEDETYNCIKANAFRLNELSGGRIREELVRLLTDRNWLKGINLLQDTGLLPYLLQQHDSESKINLKWLRPEWLGTDWRLRLAWLYAGAAEPEKQLQRLQFGRRHTREIMRLIEGLSIVNRIVSGQPTAGDTAIRQFIYRHRTEARLLLHLLNKAQRDDLLGLPAHDNLRQARCKLKTLLQLYAKRRFSLTGGDLMQSFYISGGPLMGQLRLEAELDWLLRPSAGKRELLEGLQQQHPEIRPRNRMNK